MSEDRIFVGIAIEWFKMGHNKDEIIENMTQRYSGISKEEMKNIVEEAEKVFTNSDDSRRDEQCE